MPVVHHTLIIPDAIISPSGLTLSDLGEVNLALALACGRSRGALNDRHRSAFCFLFRTIRVEFDRRGAPVPPPPYRA